MSASTTLRLSRSRVLGNRWVRGSAVLATLLLAQGTWAAEATITIGSKNFTESVILGELATLLLRDEGITARHRAALGGTRIVFNALSTGHIDAYAEYTGTIREEILSGPKVPSPSALRPKKTEASHLLSVRSRGL